MRREAKRRIAAVFITAGLVALAACDRRGGEGADCPTGPAAKTPSGFCIPRYVSLKRGEVFGRRGPGVDYPTVFVSHARGLPVQVIDETQDWRRVCDPDGGSVWVSRVMVDGRRTVMAVGKDQVTLRATPADTAAATAF